MKAKISPDKEHVEIFTDANESITSLRPLDAIAFAIEILQKSYKIEKQPNLNW